jgi:hypothetical protein
MPKSIPGVMREFKHGQLHSGSSTGPVVKDRRQAVAIAMSEQRQLHPKMKAHGQKVKAAHAHLSATTPGFNQLPAKQRFRQVQAHIRRSSK